MLKQIPWVYLKFGHFFLEMINCVENAIGKFLPKLLLERALKIQRKYYVKRKKERSRKRRHRNK